MFLPPAHVESSIPTTQQLIQDPPLGVLTTAVSSDTYPLIHIPFLLDVNDESSETGIGTLKGHMARQNPQILLITTMCRQSFMPKRSPRQLHDLSKHGEESVMGYAGKDGRPGPWEVSEAPERWLALLKTNIIGIEISITRLEGKFKMSQEMRKGDRNGVGDCEHGPGTLARRKTQQGLNRMMIDALPFLAPS
ncbi:putative FMN-binding domain-containing protein [Trichoderma chlorosporum]